MILTISDVQFKDIMKNPQFSLPIRWDGKDFECAVSSLLDEYINELYLNSQKRIDKHFHSVDIDIEKIEMISSLIKKSIREYHQGFPAAAFTTISRAMRYLMETPLKVYQKSGALEPFESDRLHLFRLRSVNDNANHTRKDLFHVPACARSMISTSRYSIAGYPSLYLTTSIELGLEEIGGSSRNAIVSRFKIIRPQKELNIRVLELGIKPQDFGEDEFQNRESVIREKRDLFNINLRDRKIRTAYLMWYPLIAACSFIRANRNSPFSSEYIIPQLLMQWVRKQVDKGNLMGIRYFSCATVRASNLGFDYVFPVNDTKYSEGYCTVLRDAFLLTNPVFIKEFNSTFECEKYLISCNDLDKV